MAPLHAQFGFVTLRRARGQAGRGSREAKAGNWIRILGRFGRLALLFAEPDFVGDQIDKALGIGLECGVVLEIVPHEHGLAALQRRCWSSSRATSNPRGHGHSRVGSSSRGGPSPVGLPMTSPRSNTPRSAPR